MIERLIICFIISMMLGEVGFEFKSKIKNVYIQYIVGKLYCMKCLCFWFTLITIFDLYQAALTGMLGWILECWILPILDKLRDKIGI